jgi:hypothetical protein
MYYSVEDRLPKDEIPVAQAKLRDIVASKTDDSLMRMSQNVIRRLEERRTGQR